VGTTSQGGSGLELSKRLLGDQGKWEKKSRPVVARIVIEKIRRKTLYKQLGKYENIPFEGKSLRGFLIECS